MLYSVGLINASIKAKGKRVSEEVLGTGRIITGNVFYLIMLDRSSGKFLSQPKHPGKRAVIRVDVRVIIRWNKYQKNALLLQVFSERFIKFNVWGEKCEIFSSFVSSLVYVLFFVIFLL